MLMRTTNSDITLHSHSHRLIDNNELDEINGLDELDEFGRYENYDGHHCNKANETCFQIFFLRSFFCPSWTGVK